MERAQRVHPHRVPHGLRWRDAFRSVLMVHNETANIWTHLLGLVVFALITLSMATGWGNTHLPALPESWTVGADHARAALVARTVQFRESRAIPRKRFAGSPNAPNDSLRRATVARGNARAALGGSGGV